MIFTNTRFLLFLLCIIYVGRKFQSFSPQTNEPWTLIQAMILFSLNRFPFFNLLKCWKNNQIASNKSNTFQYFSPHWRFLLIFHRQVGRGRTPRLLEGFFLTDLDESFSFAIFFPYHVSLGSGMFATEPMGKTTLLEVTAWLEMPREQSTWKFLTWCQWKVLHLKGFLAAFPFARTQNTRVFKSTRIDMKLSLV